MIYLIWTPWQVHPSRSSTTLRLMEILDHIPTWACLQVVYHHDSAHFNITRPLPSARVQHPSFEKEREKKGSRRHGGTDQNEMFHWSFKKNKVSCNDQGNQSSNPETWLGYKWGPQRPIRALTNPKLFPALFYARTLSPLLLSYFVVKSWFNTFSKRTSNQLLKRHQSFLTFPLERNFMGPKHMCLQVKDFGWHLTR